MSYYITDYQGNKIIIQGRVHVVALVVPENTPELRDPAHVLIAHRAVGYDGKQSGKWVVSHAGTGAAVSPQCSTRKAAIDAAQQRIDGLRPGSFMLAVGRAQQRIEERAK